MLSQKILQKPRSVLANILTPIRFLKLVDAVVLKDLDLHLVLDNYATHKTPAIHQWLPKHPRFRLHFTATSSSWLNQVSL